VKSRPVAEKIIEMLLTRKGFEYWWEPNAGGISEESQEEIIQEMMKIIEEGKE